MLLIVQVETKSEPYHIEIPNDENVECLMQLIMIETGIPLNEQRIIHLGNILKSPEQKLSSLGITEGITIRVTKQAKMYARDIPHDISAEALLQLMETHPYLLDQLRGDDEELYSCLKTKDVSELRMLLMSRVFRQYKQTYEKKRDYEEMAANQDNEDVQLKILEAIRLENVDSNLNLAQETLPESFGRVEMLYVRVEINDCAIKAFVDSGAQSTIMSAKCAEKCNLLRLLDKRFHGEARGVGTGKILGRIHIAQMKCGGSFYPISITVLETSDIDFLFGLDNLRRYNCILDLKKNVLRINNGDDIYEEMKFLSEYEMKDDTPNLFSVGGVDSGSSSSSSVATTSQSSHSVANTTSLGMDVVESEPMSAAPITTSSPTPMTSTSETKETFPSSSSSSSAMKSAPVTDAAISSTIAPSGATTTAINTSTPNDSGIEDKVKELSSLGFTTQQARDALQQTDGDVNLAASLLMDFNA